MDLRRCSLNSMTVPQLDLRELLDAAVSHGVGYVAPWRHLIEPHGLRSASEMIVERGLKVSSLCRGGFFTAPDAAQRKKAVEDNIRAINEAAALDAPVLALVCGGVVDKDVTGSYGMVRDGIAAILDHAKGAGVSLGIEPLHPMMALDRSVVTRIDDALRIIRELGSPANLGVVVDAYHVWWDVDLDSQIDRAAGRLLGFQVSDWVLPLTGSLTSGRGMMGDGCIDLVALSAKLAAAGYDGPVEVEVISNELECQDAGQVISTVVETFRNVLP
jgi:sugar phosphate isomerase/epimerase